MMTQPEIMSVMSVATPIITTSHSPNASFARTTCTINKLRRRHSKGAQHIPLNTPNKDSVK